MIGVACLLKHLHEADAVKHHAVAVSSAFYRSVVEAELHLVPTHRVADLIDHRLGWRNRPEASQELGMPPIWVC